MTFVFERLINIRLLLLLLLVQVVPRGSYWMVVYAELVVGVQRPEPRHGRPGALFSVNCRPVPGFTQSPASDKFLAL